MIETVIFDYGLAAGAVAGMFYLAHHCMGKTRDALENNTQALADLTTWLKGKGGD